MSTASIKFYLKPYGAQTTKQTIYARLLVNRTKAELSTGMRCRPEQWDDLKQRSKSSIINEELSRIESKMYAAKNDFDQEERYYWIDRTN